MEYLDDISKLQFAPFLFLNAHVKEYDKLAKKIILPTVKNLQK